MRLADAGFDLDAVRAVGLLQVERRPVPGAQLPLRLKRARCGAGKHIAPLAADRHRRDGVGGLCAGAGGGAADLALAEADGNPVDGSANLVNMPSNLKQFGFAIIRGLERNKLSRAEFQTQIFH